MIWYLLLIRIIGVLLLAKVQGDEIDDIRVPEGDNENSLIILAPDDDKENLPDLLTPDDNKENLPDFNNLAEAEISSSPSLAIDLSCKEQLENGPGNDEKVTPHLPNPAYNVRAELPAIDIKGILNILQDRMNEELENIFLSDQVEMKKKVTFENFQEFLRYLNISSLKSNILDGIVDLKKKYKSLENLLSSQISDVKTLCEDKKELQDS